MKRIRWRLVAICGLVAASLFSLIPRDVERRAYDPASGQVRETTVRRVPIDLGLDLRGGIHLALEVDRSRAEVADCADAIRRAERVVRTRVDEFGTSDAVVQVVGDCRLIVELPGVTDPERARSIVQRTAFLEFRLTDPDDRFGRALRAIDEAIAGSDPTAALASLLRRGRVPGEFFVPEARADDVERLLARPEVERHIPRGLELMWGSRTLSLGDGEPYRPLYAVDARAIITGDELQRAVAARDPMTGAAEVQFELNRTGARRFADATSRNIGNHLAIVLDGRVEGRPPVIRDRIASSGRIELGGRSLEEANDLALVLRAGALPVPLEVVDRRTIGPSLGHDSIRAGVRASAIAVGLVLAIMAVYYGFFGVLALGGLFTYLLYVLAGLAAFGFDLTLPGLAGFALSIGMAVDANVLIFERIREELAAGRAIRSAVDRGFRHAMSAIVDSNITTALTALVLYRIGTGPVQGFAITLLVGLAASMVTAIFVMRTFFLIWLRRRRVGTPRGLSVRRLGDVGFDFLRVRRWAYALSGALILPGLLLLAAQGVTYSVEFTGGTLAQVRTAEPVGTAALRSALDEGGLAAAEIKRFGSDRDYVVRARLDVSAPTETRTTGVGLARDDTAVAGDARTESSGERDAGDGGTGATADAVRAALDAGLGEDGYELVRTASVSPKVGDELQRRAGIAVVVSFAATLIYLAARFEWRFGLAAVLAAGHDILASLAFIRYLDLEVSLVLVAGLLTVLGYSLNDTIVVFDRIRENLRKDRRRELSAILGRSINETLPRTLLTSGTTLAAALVLAFFAGDVIESFGLVMSFGVVVGTFSSIFVAAPTLLWIARRMKRRPAGPGVRT
ncbi:MAG: protein translocase subunit SecD, partial [Gemmatimonadota bacterium]